jgi:phage head maturation protease
MTHFIVEGVRYDKAQSVYRKAIELGFNGSLDTVYQRLKRGASTWAEIAAITNPAYRHARVKRVRDSRSEANAAIAALDERKAEMARRGIL